MKYQLFIIFLLISFVFYGQNQKKLDSLKVLLSDTEISQHQAQLNLNISKLIENKNRDSSKIYAKTTEKIALRLRDKDLLSKAFLQQGKLFYKQQKDDVALIFFNKIDSLYQIEKVITEDYIMTKIYRAEISKFRLTMPGVLKAKDYILEAINLAEETNDEKLINLTKYRLGEWHGFMSQARDTKEHLDTARIYVNKVLEYYQKEKNYKFIANVYYTLASIDASSKDYKAAEINYKKRLEVIKKSNDSVKISEAYYGLGSVFRRFNQPDKGLKYLDSAAAIFKTHGFSTDDRRKNLYKDYAYLYELKNDYKNAFVNMQKAFVFKDSIFKEENSKNAIELDAKYQAAKKEREIILLKSQKKLSEEQKTNQRNLYLGGLGLTTIAGLFFFVLFQNRQKTTKKLKELDDFKSKLFANISHEFRTPLTLISGPIDKRINSSNLTEEDRTDFEMIQRNSDRLLNLVDQLLDLSKLEAGHLKLKVSQGDLSVLLKSMASSFQHQATQKHINYTINIDELNNVWFDKDVIEKTVINLLSNAFKYTPKNSAINFNALVLDDTLQLQVENKGNLLTKKQVDNIFNRFYQADENTEGVGIGLSLVKEIVNLSYGEITVENTSNKTILFKVYLPILKSQFKPSDFAGVFTNPSMIKQKEDTIKLEKAAVKAVIDENRPILLIVDDHEDIRTFVKSVFKDSYQVVEAANGEIGVEKAIVLVPDIIISDVMMPKLNGFQLSEILKQDERTSHIPIILLTAKTEDTDRFKGLETGADDYITKPFKTKLLEIRVKKLIESRLKLRERYSQELVLKPTDIAINNFDAQFLEKVNTVIDDNITEPNFSAADFSKALGMSRMQLHRKLKALTGLSATEFVRSQRLKLAADLLKKSDANVSEIGYSVGFNDHSYFAKCFKEMYGCSPTEFISKQ
ncbi:response regulator [Winogradskyella psychrotolerans]|uniref:response regulator n=1 Tax=Winogradskyella psychrotolerans TaxID=1344585 RepID=UPI001C079A3C|nr:response regulator [Winogradskyella psychrotolerans]